MAPSSEWHEGMLQPHALRGPYISRASAAYPQQINRLIAASMLQGAVSVRLSTSQAHSMVRTGKWANTLRKADVRTENAFSRVEAGKVQIIDGLLYAFSLL